MIRFFTLLISLVAVAAAGLSRGPQGIFPGERPMLAVAPFVDASGGGLLGAEQGIAGMLVDRLEAVGYTVLPPQALESWLSGQGIEARSPGEWVRTAAALGADYLLLGTLDSLSAAKVTLNLGFISVQGVSASARLGLEVVDPATGEEVARLQAEGSGQGQATASFNMFFSLSWDVCGGGLRTSKTAYLSGEPVVIGYRDPSPPGTVYVVVRPADLSGPSWVSPWKSTTAADPCVTWTWDQTFGGTPAAPGDYTVEVYRIPVSGPIAWTSFRVLPEPAGWSAELRVGTPEFSGTAWNQAIGAALDGLVDQLFHLFQGAP